MFGGLLERPKLPVSKERIPVEKRDLSQPCVTSPIIYAHRARQANSNYAVRLLHFKQRRAEFDEKVALSRKRDNELNSIQINLLKHQETAVLKKRIQTKLQNKLEAYEESIDRRRERLRDLIAKEERELIRETVDTMQKADDDKLTKMKKRSEELKAANEAERQKIVHQKRIQQYGLKCQELRPFFSKKQTVESKVCQLQQMRENQARREAEKEIDMMWHDVLRRQEEARYERDLNDAVKKYNECRALTEVLCKQMQAKKLMEARQKEVDIATKKELEDQQKAMKNKEIQELINKRLTSEQNLKELKEQVDLQKKFRDQKLAEEKAMDEALLALNQLELKKEASKQSDSKEQMRREIDTYKHYLAVLKERHKEENDRIEKLLQDYSNEAMRLEREKFCKKQTVKDKLLQDVLKERQEQVEYKKRKALQDLEMQKQETEMIRSILEMNKRLNVEAERLNRMAARQYRDDLNKQIEYNNCLRMREIADAEARLNKSLEEEAKYQSIVNLLLTTDEYNDMMGVHPFRNILGQVSCCCPEENSELKK